MRILIILLAVLINSGCSALATKTYYQPIVSDNNIVHNCITGPLENSNSRLSYKKCRINNKTIDLTVSFSDISYSGILAGPLFFTIIPFPEKHNYEDNNLTLELINNKSTMYEINLNKTYIERNDGIKYECHSMSKKCEIKNTINVFTKLPSNITKLVFPVKMNEVKNFSLNISLIANNEEISFNNLMFKQTSELFWLFGP